MRQTSDVRAVVHECSMVSTAHRTAASAASDEDPLGVAGFATHHLPLEEAPHAYEIFQEKEDNAFKILLEP
jgi:threonine dehydrogenase-like Zn-dependent dehydrogenase